MKFIKKLKSAVSFRLLIIMVEFTTTIFRYKFIHSDAIIIRWGRNINYENSICN